MSVYKFQIGDRVQVVSDCSSRGKKGTIRRYCSTAPYSQCKYVQVELDYGSIQNYNEESLKLIKHKEENIMQIHGNYDVVMVKFIQGTNTIKPYAFMCFDETIRLNDLVLCDTSNGYGVAEVMDIIPRDCYEGSPVTKEIICKVDFSDFNRRKANREQAQKLQKEMDKKIAQMQGMMFYEMMAEKNPELKDMLEEYKKLVQ